jgi:hypothetical protein
MVVLPGVVVLAAFVTLAVACVIIWTIASSRRQGLKTRTNEQVKIVATAILNFGVAAVTVGVLQSILIMGRADPAGVTIAIGCFVVGVVCVAVSILILTQMQE